MTKITQPEVDDVTLGKMDTCPFCGEVPLAEPWHGGRPRKTMVSCQNITCPAAPEVCGETPEAALSYWNERS